MLIKLDTKKGDLPYAGKNWRIKIFEEWRPFNSTRSYGWLRWYGHVERRTKDRVARSSLEQNVLGLRLRGQSCQMKTSYSEQNWELQSEKWTLLELGQTLDDDEENKISRDFFSLCISCSLGPSTSTVVITFQTLKNRFSWEIEAISHHRDEYLRTYHILETFTTNTEIFSLR